MASHVVFFVGDVIEQALENIDFQSRVVEVFIV
jgi:hypothetical protein